MLHEQAELTGTVHQGVIVVDGGAELPEGQTVKIIIEPRDITDTPQAETVGQRLMKFAGIMEGLPPDFALNHDHYLYGADKRQ